jgi:hypothetical protein
LVAEASRGQTSGFGRRFLSMQKGTMRQWARRHASSRILTHKKILRAAITVLQAVLFGVVAEGAVSDFEKLGGAGAHAASLL